MAAIGAGVSNVAVGDRVTYTGFVNTDNGFYKPIRDAGLATGKLTPRQ